MFKKSKVLTREYMQDYKSKRDKKVPRLEKKIRRILIRYINKGIKITIKYGEKEMLFKLSKYNVLNDSLAGKMVGIKVSEHPYSRFKGDYIFDLEGVFDNDN